MTGLSSESRMSFRLLRQMGLKPESKEAEILNEILILLLISSFRKCTRRDSKVNTDT